MVERFNGRIADVLKTHRFNSREDMEQTLLRYVALYNHQLPQSALKSSTPMQAMKEWYQTHPHLFHKRPYDRPGCDTYEGDSGQHEGAYFGWWNFATKLNLALAAGVALPLLALLGYTPGTRSEAGLQTLSLAYAVLPCLLKLAAAAALYLLVVRRTPGSAAFQAP